jgi:hypothetical protein
LVAIQGLGFVGGKNRVFCAEEMPYLSGFTNFSKTTHGVVFSDRRQDGREIVHGCDDD